MGVNHLAIEVSDIEAALGFYGKIFDVEVFRRDPDAAFLGMGDQFLVLVLGKAPHQPDIHRHFGLVVDDRSSARALAMAAGADMIESRFLDFRDPWGNFVQVVEYADIQFTKTHHVLRGMGLSHLTKSANALAELREKGMAPEGTA